MDKTLRPLRAFFSSLKINRSVTIRVKVISKSYPGVLLDLNIGEYLNSCMVMNQHEFSDSKLLAILCLNELQWNTLNSLPTDI